MVVVDPHPDTVKHRVRVEELLGAVVADLRQRAADHDLSKTRPPEVEAFNAATDRLAGLEYGSDAYKEALRDLGPALAHHYAGNSHHPEAHAGGISGMTLLDLVEMLADWRAAGERMSDGSMARSLPINVERFRIDPQLARIMANTVAALGW